MAAFANTVLLAPLPGLILRLAGEFIALHLTSPRCSLQLMDMLPGGQMYLPPRARQAVQALAADQVQ
jgi:hypothetical protein